MTHGQLTKGPDPVATLVSACTVTAVGRVVLGSIPNCCIAENSMCIICVRAYLAMACNEVVSEGGAGRGLGFDGVNGEAVRYELDECCPVAGHQHLIRS